MPVYPIAWHEILKPVSAILQKTDEIEKRIKIFLCNEAKLVGKHLLKTLLIVSESPQVLPYKPEKSNFA